MLNPQESEVPADQKFWHLAISTDLLLPTLCGKELERSDAMLFLHPIQRWCKSANVPVMYNPISQGWESDYGCQDSLLDGTSTRTQ